MAEAQEWLDAHPEAGPRESDASSFDLGYAEGYRRGYDEGRHRGYDDGRDYERDAIADRLAKDVAERDAPKMAVEPVLTSKGEPGWVSTKTGRVLKAVTLTLYDDRTN